jgi:uncharacterized protein
VEGKANSAISRGSPVNYWPTIAARSKKKVATGTKQTPTSAVKNAPRVSVSSTVKPDEPAQPNTDIGTKERALIDGALKQVGITTQYDPAYVRLDYPNGDVPITTGVCSDVLIRAYRSIGIDLQVLLHEDMRTHFSAYPTRWGMKTTDRNIDHRRVLNLATYFTRKGGKLAVTQNATDYRPGDVVTWDLDGRPHTGLVSNERTSDGTRFKIVHNVGEGAQHEDVLFAWPITGHYHWLP